MLLYETRRVKRRPRWRRPLLILGAGLVVTAGILAYPKVTGHIRGWRASRAVTRAGAFARAGDTANALLSLRLAARIAPFDGNALQVAADVLEQAGSAEAVSLRRQQLGLAPDDLDAREALVRTALRFHDIDTAEEAMSGLPLKAQSTARAARLRAAIADAARPPAEREEALSTLLRLAPDDVLAQYELASLQLRDPTKAPAARHQLEALSASGPARQSARRALAQDALQRRDALAAVRWAGRLADDPDVVFADRLFQLNVDRLLDPPGAARRLRELQARASSKPADSAALATWMLLHFPAADVVRWLDSLPAATRTSPPLLLVRADAGVVLQDWSDVRRRLAAGAWGTVPEPTLELAFASHQLRTRQRDELAGRIWDEALVSTNYQAGPLRVLYRLALAWGADRDVEATLRVFGERVPDQHWALQELLRRAHQRRDTAAMRDVLATWSRLNPQSRRLRSDWALTILLLNPGRPSEPVRQLTRESCQAEPSNPRVVAVRALCLWRDDKPAEALALLGALPTAQLRAPGRALLYGGLLAHLGRADEAQPYLELAAQAPLLPEEAEMLRAARAAAGLPPSSAKS